MASAQLINDKSMEESQLLTHQEDYFDPAAVVSEAVPPAVESSGVSYGSANVVVGRVSGEEEKREIVLGRNVHTTCLTVTEPDADDESTGDKEAYMASVLARYRKTLVERTKHHLGTIFFPVLFILGF